MKKTYPPPHRSVESLTHKGSSRKNIPTAEHRVVMGQSEQRAIQVAYERRNRDLDPQLVWRGKDEQDHSDLLIQVPPLYIQEKVHPKVLVDDLIQRTMQAKRGAESDRVDTQTDLFADFNGLPSQSERTEFYEHDANWSNRMILGDSLQVMASLAEREGLRGKVQCIYLDPPYGIKFNSNFQWSTTSPDVRDGKADHITREPEQVKAFRDTWRDGIHSYLTYLRDRLTVARDLLLESGSIFVQIGDENVGRIRLLMDEIFGDDNFVTLISYAKTSGFSGSHISSVCDYLLWYAKSLPNLKYRSMFDIKELGGKGASKYRPVSSIKALSRSHFEPEKFARLDQLTSQGASSNSEQRFWFRGKIWSPPLGLHWKTTVANLNRLSRAGRIEIEGKSICYVRFLDDFPAYPRTNLWLDIGGVQSRSDPKIYVVQTAVEAVKRCILATTDPSDIVLDPTCGAGTTAYVAEKWGRRWITIDTSRVALALARGRIMGARFPYFLLADERRKEKETIASNQNRIGKRSKLSNDNDIRQGFVYQKLPHITLKSIANDAEIDIIWEKYQDELEMLCQGISRLIGRIIKEWEIPQSPDDDWPDQLKELHASWQKTVMERQKEIDASIKANAEFEHLYDRPYEDMSKVRVAGPFTVESVSPHRVLVVDERDEFVDPQQGSRIDYRAPRDFASMILENLRTSGVQQAQKEDKISFSAVLPWPGDLICADGRYIEGVEDSGTGRRAAIMIGPEFGSVTRPDLVAAAKEAAESGFDVLVACAFNFEAHASELNRLGRVPILKARMNADLHMADDLRSTGKGNLFVIFGEPDIDVFPAEGDDPATGRIQVRVNGVDVFHPSTGEIRSDNADGIACWFIDTDYNEESFFVRHAYFLGANDPYKALRTTLKAEINREAWESLRSDTSRPFDRPKSGRIAVKVINHLGDEVMKIFRVDRPS